MQLVHADFLEACVGQDFGRLEAVVISNVTRILGAIDGDADVADAIELRAHLPDFAGDDLVLVDDRVRPGGTARALAGGLHLEDAIAESGNSRFVRTP